MTWHGLEGGLRFLNREGGREWGNWGVAMSQVRATRHEMTIVVTRFVFLTSRADVAWGNCEGLHV